MLFDTRKFHYFKVLSQELSVSKAAQKLFISQPSLSKFLSQLEEEIGERLFDRGASSMTLTPAGDHFLEYIRDASRLYEHYMRTVEDLTHGQSGELHIGIGPWRSSFLVNKVFPEFQKDYPRLRLMLYEEPNLKMRQMLAKKQIDIAISAHSNLDFEGDVALPSTPVMKERLLIVLSKLHPLSTTLDLQRNSLSTPQKLDLRLLARRCLISGKPGQRINDDIRDIVQRYDLGPCEIIETINIDTAIALAAHNFGIAFVPESYLLNSPLLDRLVFFFSDEPLLNWQIVAEYCNDAPSPAERHFVDLLIKVYGRLMA